MTNHSEAPRFGTAAEFAEWCKARANKHVGYAGRTGSCPIANWLRSLNPGRKLHITSYGVEEPPFEDRQVLARIPEWACEFVEALDTVIPSEPGWRDVSGEQAIAVMREYVDA